MKKRILLFVFLIALFAVSTVQPATGWIDKKIYVQKIDREIQLDGSIGDGEWTSEEERFSEQLSGLVFLTGDETDIDLEVKMVRDDQYLYVLLTVESEIAGFEGNISLGMGIADKGDDIGDARMMDNYLDRRFAYHNVSTGEVQTYDLYSCQLTDSCIDVGEEGFDVRQSRPGFDDANKDIEAAYGLDNGKPFLEMRFNLSSSDPTQDFDIGEGTNFRFIVNPYGNVYFGGIGGHGALATENLELSWEPRSIFERPEGPMDGLAILFNVVFGGLVVIISLAILISNRSEKWAKKMWSVNITEDQVNKSVIMEIGYYNSSFLAIFGLFLFWLYTVIAVIYGWWANWGVPGIIINGIPFLASTAAMVDLVQRNHNPHDVPKEQKKDHGDDLEKTGGLWIVPPLFLLMTLFMLVFIGIDVIS